MSRLATISFYYLSDAEFELCTLLIHYWYTQGAQGIDSTFERWNGEGMRFITKKNALARLRQLFPDEPDCTRRVETCHFWLDNARFELIVKTNGTITEMWINVLWPTWCRPHPYCDEYIDWERYSKLVLDAPITAPLVGITTFDTEYLT